MSIQGKALWYVAKQQMSVNLRQMCAQLDVMVKDLYVRNRLSSALFLFSYVAQSPLKLSSSELSVPRSLAISYHHHVSGTRKSCYIVSERIH